MVITTYICDDCGRRFFNLGWHAEACGSPNFRAVDALEESRDGSGPEAASTTKGKATS